MSRAPTIDDAKRALYRFHGKRSSAFRPISKQPEETLPTMKGLSEYMVDCERQYIVDAICAARGNITKAAIIAKRNRTEFYRVLVKCGIVLLPRYLKG